MIFLDEHDGEKEKNATMVCWALWKCRNDLVWKQKNMEVSQVVVLAQTVLNQWKSVQDRTQDSSLSLLSVDDGTEHWGNQLLV